MSVIKKQNDSYLMSEKDNSMQAYNLEFRTWANKKWDREYLMEPTIPSSHRLNPSHALLEVEEDINYLNSDVLDLGCGNGRNSIYMAKKGAKVFSLDFSLVAINILRENLIKTKPLQNIETISRDVCDGLPFSDESLDIVLDSYCLCHFIDIESAVKAMSECNRVLKPGGKLIKIHLTDEDEYYKERLEMKMDFGHISRDPVNDIMKAHFSTESYKKNIARNFTILKTKTIEFVDEVRGKEYTRNIFISILEK